MCKFSQIMTKSIIQGNPSPGRVTHYMIERMLHTTSGREQEQEDNYQKGYKTETRTLLVSSMFFVIGKPLHKTF